MSVIKVYNRNGELHEQLELTNKNIKLCIGQMTKCILFDGSEKVGFADVLRSMSSDSYDDTIREYINLWTWKNLDPVTHQLVGNDNKMYEQIKEKVFIKDIKNMYSIRYSSARWGGELTNTFDIDIDIDIDI